MDGSTCANMRQAHVKDQSACGEELQWVIYGKRSKQIADWCQGVVRYLTYIVKKSSPDFGCLGLVTA